MTSRDTIRLNTYFRYELLGLRNHNTDVAIEVEKDMYEWVVFNRLVLYFVTNQLHIMWNS